MSANKVAKQDALDENKVTEQDDQDENKVTEQDDQDRNADFEGALSDFYDRLAGIESALSKLNAGLDSVRESQAVMVENGLSIREVADPDQNEQQEEDDFKSITELDLSI